MSPINILYTSHVSDMEKGGQISLYNLIKRLDRRVYRPLLLCPSNGALSNNFKKQGCSSIFLKFPHFRVRNIPLIPFYLLKALKLLRKNHISLIHTDHPTDTFYLALCSRLLGIPLIWHARVSFNSRLDHLNTVFATKVIGVSKAVSYRFRVKGRVNEKYVTIYNGVDCNKFRPQHVGTFRSDFGVNKKQNVIAFVGQITAEKGIEDFIDAAKIVHEETNACRFFIAGTGSDRFVDELKNKIQFYGLTAHLKFLGYRTDIVPILNVSDFLVLPSRPCVEGLPRVVIEAMSCGLPVVGTNVQGTNEAIDDGNTGILVPPKDPKKLANAFLTLLDDKKKARRMGIAGRERVKRLFSIEKNVSEIQGTYKKILNA